MYLAVGAYVTSKACRKHHDEERSNAKLTGIIKPNEVFTLFTVVSIKGSIYGSNQQNRTLDSRPTTVHVNLPVKP